MDWLSDLAITIVMGILFFDLFAGHQPLAWAVALVGGFYLLTMFDEVVFHYTGHHPF